MKKYLALFVAALAFAGCTKELPVDEPGADEVTSIVFDFAINRPDDTKAVKTGWESGDRIYVFFEGVTTGYVTIVFNGTEWSTPVLNDSGSSSASVADLTESGKHLTAVYLPFNNSATCEYNGMFWGFTGGVEALSSYYLSTDWVSYTVSISGGIATLSAPLALRAPEGLVQIFIPDAGATGTITMSCNSLKSVQLGNIGGDATLFPADYPLGSNIVGHATTIKGAKGYYAYGLIPADWSETGDADGYEWYFTFNYGGVYYDFYKHLGSRITGGTAIKLDKSHLHIVGPGYYVQMGGLLWSTVNSGAETPWDYFYDYQESNPYYFVQWGNNPTSFREGERIPSKADVQALRTAMTAVNESVKEWWITVNEGTEGLLCVDDADASKYLFFPATGGGSSMNGKVGRYWTSTESESGPNYGVQFIGSKLGYGAYRIGAVFQPQKKTDYYPVRPVKDIPAP